MSPRAPKDRPKLDLEVVHYSRAGHVATIVMDDPHKLNALSRQMGRDVSAAVALAEADPAVRCVVLTGAGPRAFCSGADLKDPGTHSQDKAGDAVGMFFDWEISSLARMRKPLIAAVNGICVGGGVEYLLACDIRIASEDARFWFTQTGLGIFPAGGGTSRLVRAIGLSRAMQMVLTGEEMDAQEAWRTGLVNEVLPRERLLPRAQELASAIASKAPLGVLFAKQSLKRGAELRLDDAMVEDGMRVFALYGSDDRKEASRAWLEKRAPVFKGR